MSTTPTSEPTKLEKKATRLAKRAERKARAAVELGKGVDNAVVHWVGLGLCGAGIIGGGSSSIEGLWHTASWFERPEMQWTLAMAVDPFLVGLAVLGIVFRKRRQWAAALLAAGATLALVVFSMWANYHYQSSISDPATDAGRYGPIIKATMPVLLLLGIEFGAAIFATRTEVPPAERTVVQPAVDEGPVEYAVSPRSVVEADRTMHQLERVPTLQIAQGPEEDLEAWVREIVRTERRLPTGKEIGAKVGRSVRWGQRFVTAMRQRDEEFDGEVATLVA